MIEDSLARDSLIDTLTMRKLLHDLKSPLTALKILRARRSLDRPEDGLLKATLIHLENLLASCVGDAPALDAILKADQIHQLCLNLVREKQVLAGQPIDFVWQADGVELKLAPVDLHKILSNLLQNGIDACQKGAGRVRLEVARCERHMEFRIFDEGQSRELENERPRRRLRLRRGGWGVGLMIVRELVRESGGRLSYCSRAEQGTVAVVSYLQA